MLGNQTRRIFLRNPSGTETETYRNRKFDPETEISASGSTFGFVSAQPLIEMTEQHDILQCDKDLGGEKEPGKALARSEALLPASVAGAFVVDRPT